MSTLEKPAVDTDIEHLDFPSEDVKCEGENCGDVATHRLSLDCGCVHLICDIHADHARMVADRFKLGRCRRCEQPAHLVSLLPIH